MVICAGSGGVGKTTTAAAVALGLAERRAEGRRRDDRPGAAAGERARARASSATSRAASSVEVDGELWAMMLDAKRTFDQLIERLAPDARTRDEVLRQPDLPAALERGRRLAGVHRDRQALRARPARAASTCSCSTRRRRATRSTSSTRPARLTRFFQGRAIRMFLRPAGLAGGARPRHRRRLRRAAAGHGRRPAARPVGVLPLAGRDDRRLHRARPARRRAAGGPGDDVPDRHRAAPRPGRGGDLLPPQAARGGDAVRRAGRQPRAPAAATTSCRERWPTSSARRWPSASSAAAGELAALAARDAANVERLRSALGDPPTIVVPELADDVHDLEGLARVRSHLFERPEPLHPLVHGAASGGSRRGRGRSPRSRRCRSCRWRRA